MVARMAAVVTERFYSMISKVMCLSIFVLLPARALQADSDGYYCVGAGYIAVEFRSFNTRGLRSAHVLKIARFDRGLGPRWSGEISIEDFQTHSLSCGFDTIVIEGAGERGRGLVSYVLKMTGDQIEIASHRSDPTYAFTSFPQAPRNIGNLARPGVYELPDRGAFPRYRLVVTRTSVKGPGVIEHFMRSTLEEVAPTGIVSRSLLINSGTLIETTH
jgi:hypothetical protein